MAHHIAELINECDTADVAASTATQERCASAILELWAHRASLTGTSKPFQDLAPIIHTLRQLDPEAEHFFYSRTIPNIGGAANEETTRWLNFARNCDVIARMLIGMGIDEASKHTGGDASGWAYAASKAGLASEFDVQISDLLDKRLNDAEKADERRVRDLRDRIEKLESFSAMASALRAELQKQVEDLENAKQPG
jgi:hypothetical protein